MKNSSAFPLDRIQQIQNHPENFRLIEKMGPVSGPITERVGDELPIVFIDFETTGLSHDEDAVVEVGFVRCSYSPSEKRLVSVDGIASFLQDPGRPIPPEATAVHGITDADVSGKAITEQDLETWLYGDPLMVAHNAPFDRPWMDRLSPGREPFLWACSKEDVDWRSLGYEARALSYLCLMNGFFYDGHRASVDCAALAHLFALNQEAFAQMLDSAQESRWRLLATYAPYESKDDLKSNGYRWDGSARVWWKEIVDAQIPEEKSLLDTLYPQGGEKATLRKIDPRQRFSRRQMARR